ASAFIGEKTGGRGLVDQQHFRQHGLDVVTGVLAGEQARRVAVIARGREAFVFIGATKGRTTLASVDGLFMQVVHSFRPLQLAERKYGEPHRLALVQLRGGQSLEELSRQMSGEGDRLQRLRLLNGLYPGGQPRTGAWLKVVR